MHEMSLCYGLLSQVENIAQQRQAKQVTKITVQIGILAGVEPRLLASAFEMVKLGTIAETAELVLDTQPIRVHCQQCHTESEVTVNRILCLQCGSWQTRIISGNELLLASVELSL